MGIKSTYSLTREVALSIIENTLHSATNDELGYMLECFEKQSEFRNYWVYDELSGDENFVIKSIEEFNKIPDIEF